jgi:trehalose 6-phosphate synthase/phosphatase
MVSRINSKLQSIGEDGPIQYIVQGSDMPPEKLAGLYAAAEVLICTPIRDGINTTPFEYLVCREALGELGVVVLSEFAGCAHSLSGAILTNPWDSVGCVTAVILVLAWDSVGCVTDVTSTSVGFGRLCYCCY